MYVDEEQWTVRKTMQSVRLMLRKIGVDADVFKGGKDEEEDIGVGEERRVFLDQLFN